MYVTGSTPAASSRGRLILPRKAPHPLLADIQAFMRRTKMPPSRFGRMAVGDPRLVFDLERGRMPGEAVRRRVAAIISGQDCAHD